MVHQFASSFFGREKKSSVGKLPTVLVSVSSKEGTLQCSQQYHEGYDIFNVELVTLNPRKGSESAVIVQKTSSFKSASVAHHYQRLGCPSISKVCNHLRKVWTHMLRFRYVASHWSRSLPRTPDVLHLPLSM